VLIGEAAREEGPAEELFKTRKPSFTRATFFTSTVKAAFPSGIPANSFLNRAMQSFVLAFGVCLSHSIRAASVSTGARPSDGVEGRVVVDLRFL
jgi:hypothetical protein